MPPLALSLEAVGIAVAAAVVALSWLLLPGGARGLVRQPLLFLALSVAALALSHAVPEDSPSKRASLLAATLLLLAAIGRAMVLLVLDVAVGRRLQRPPPRIVRDIVQGLVWFAILLVALRAVGFEPGSLLTTSALLTAAVALSLQETLGNLVAGLAIQVQRPFDVDDWIQFDGEAKHVGKVIEINWRATKVITLDEVEIIIPNATLAKVPITNFTKPTRSSRRSLFVYAAVDAAPHVVRQTILDALGGSLGMLREPAPSVVTNAFTEGNVEYWVRFYTDRFEQRDGVDGAARDRVWYALRRAGLSPASSPNRAVHLQEISAAARATEEQARAAREQALRKVDFLAVLSDEQLQRLAARSVIRFYADGEPIVRQGGQSAEMFVVESGEVAVSVERPSPQGGAHEDVVVARLDRGKFFGEMALMTGEPRRATVRAAGPCTLLVIDERALRAVFETAPEVAQHISRVIAERQAVLAEQEAHADRLEDRPSVEERSLQLLGRIRKFFSL